MKKKKSFGRWLRTSMQAPLLLVGAVLFVWYMFSLATYLASPPSSGMSRELLLAKLAYGDNENTEFHVTAIEMSDSSVVVAAVDGKDLRLLRTDSRGEILEQISASHDFSDAIYLDGFQSDGNTVTLVAMAGTEERTISAARIDIRSGDVSAEFLERGVQSFRLLGDQLLIQRQDGLYLKNLGAGGATTLLMSGNIHSWAARKLDGIVYIMANRRAGDMIEGILTRYSTGGETARSETTVLSPASRDDYSRDLRDIYISDGLVSALYLWTDKRDGVNYLTVRQYRFGTSGETVSTTGPEQTALNTETAQTASFYGRFPIHKGRFDLLSASPGSAVVLLQADTVNGVNLVQAVLTTENQPLLQALTKTRKFSKLSDYTISNGNLMLIFCDFERDRRVVNLASSHPEAIQASSRLATISPLNVTVISLLVLAMALFMGGIGYLLLTSFLPAAGLLALQQLTPDYRHKLPLQLLLAIVAQTAIKLLLTNYVINQTAYYRFGPLLIGGEPVIYLVLLLTSLVSAAIMFKYHKKSLSTAAATSSAYTRFVISDYLQYTLLVFMYICTSLIIGKI